MVNTVSKAAMRKGMNDFVFAMYSNAFAACFLFLITSFHYRNTTLPLLSYDIIGLLFVVGLLSCTNQMLKFFGIGYSSPTLASVLSDLVPAFTSILAIIFSTWAKSIGTFLSIGGALIISLYKGKSVINNDLSLKLFPQKLASSTEFDWVFGATLLAARSCFVSINFVLMTWIVEKYPEEKVVVFIRIALTSMLSVPAAVISVKDRKDLRLGFNMELIAIACSVRIQNEAISYAIFVLSFRRFTHTCALRKGGPVYVAMFKPLERVFAVILGITFLGDSLYVGSVIGAIIVVIGFYAAIWGKSQEKSEEDSAGKSEEDRAACCESFPTEADPLLAAGM
ncbi:hypothetical protein Fmac_007614 [Flemingia macrophylla]|uniref:WAT1-related protein n=1 Tax=Flemingia macrophylla TaxID=520843 RepID=A0ABD1MV55_9FABA